MPLLLQMQPIGEVFEVSLLIRFMSLVRPPPPLILESSDTIGNRESTPPWEYVLGTLKITDMMETRLLVMIILKT